MFSALKLPQRTSKPRTTGISCLTDTGLPTGYFKDVIETHNELIDYVKFGWGSSIMTRDLQRKTDILTAYGISYFFGGTLFEKAIQNDCIADYLKFCESCGCKLVEISNGTLAFPLEEKCELIRKISSDFIVWSEVGFKDPQLSLDFPPSQWIESIMAELKAGSEKVITESRESGKCGICRRDGEVRYGLIEDILASDIDKTRLIFETPNNSLQTYFILKLGANVNLANLSFSDILSVETLRLGLRSDTFYI